MKYVIILVIIILALWMIKNHSVIPEIGKQSLQFRKIIDFPEATSMDWINPDVALTTSKGGIIYLVNIKEKKSKPFVDIRDIDSSFSDDGMEMGLMGIAHFQNDTLYVSYTCGIGKKSSCLKVMKVQISYDGDIKLKKLLITIPAMEKYHHAGTLIFTPSGELILSSGDGGPQGDPKKVAQQMKGPNRYRGKIIKLDTTGRGNHSILALGLRNPWKISYNREGILIGDVGWDSKERIYLMPSIDSSVPYNFGWPYIEGSKRSKNHGVIYDFDLPSFEYNTSDKEGRATLGGYFVGGVVVIADWLGYVRVLEINSRSFRDPWKVIKKKKAPQKLQSLSLNPFTGKLYALGEKSIYLIL